MAKASDFEGKKPEELFYFVDYSPEEAERIGYSNYSYWGSVRLLLPSIFHKIFPYLSPHLFEHKSVHFLVAKKNF